MLSVVCLAVLISSAHAGCACDATGGMCLYAGNGEYTCDVPEDSTCSDVWKTSTMGIYQYESKQPCAGIKRGEGRTCFVAGCAGDFCMGSAIKRIIYKLADGNCYKPWESCTRCDVLSHPEDRRKLLPVSCPKMECALSGQRAFSFDCRGRCASGYSCHAASGQCRWHMNTRSSSCAGTCGNGYCCNHQSNRCDKCGTETALADNGEEKAVGSCYSKCKRDGGSQDYCTHYCGYNSEYSQAFTGASSTSSTFSVVNVFAAFGLGVVLYGSFRHYVK